MADFLQKQLRLAFRVNVWLVLCLLVSSSGCGAGSGSGPQSKMQVSGSLTVDNKPVPYAFLEFHPAGVAYGEAVSTLLEDGKFEISKEKGLTPGEYDVLVIGYAPEDFEKYDQTQLLQFARAREMIPEFYQRPGALKVRIAEGKSDGLVLKLSSKSPQ